MTILHDTCPVTHGAEIMPIDPTARYHRAALHLNLRVSFISGTHAVEGRIVDVVRPDLTSSRPAPLITVDTGRGCVIGPVNAGDLIAAPTVSRPAR